ncbi:hypothetical protein BDK51DRAFT_42097 [Blyttiomyces helicus]|uniref:Uncharacterized protein n=1 Tax=Blyttiomyces helicus TaxID=388810 RepID=A0A4P9W8V1_9FUNG|nr:hypothetical protein BDK51DRAFT_42097 [Blyttiomyces helicus]|eukprot:RKO87220.1 hypothetical protein BDK51DRAFT_42097 [Blyttiomyces helicus]
MSISRFSGRLVTRRTPFRNASRNLSPLCVQAIRIQRQTPLSHHKVRMPSTPPCSRAHSSDDHLPQSTSPGDAAKYVELEARLRFKDGKMSLESDRVREGNIGRGEISPMARNCKEAHLSPMKRAAGRSLLWVDGLQKIPAVEDRVGGGKWSPEGRPVESSEEKGIQTNNLRENHPAQLTVAVLVTSSAFGHLSLPRRPRPGQPSRLAAACLPQRSALLFDILPSYHSHQTRQNMSLSRCILAVALFSIGECFARQGGQSSSGTLL